MSNSLKPVRLILADDHTLVRAGIRSLLEKLSWVQVLAEASNGREVLALVKIHEPNIVLMDLSMPGLNGLEATARLTKEFPKVRVIILSMHHNVEYYWRALKAGAAGYLLKKAATDELAAALQKVIHGEIYLSQEISRRLVEKFPLQSPASGKSPFETLTAREREVLQLVAEGKANKETAAELGISSKTVEKHRKNLMEKLNIHDTASLTRYAIGVGVIEGSDKLPSD